MAQSSSGRSTQRGYGLLVTICVRTYVYALAAAHQPVFPTSLGILEGRSVSEVRQKLEMVSEKSFSR